MNKPTPKVVIKKGAKSLPTAVNDNDADDKSPGRNAILARLQERAKK